MSKSDSVNVDALFRRTARDQPEHPAIKRAHRPWMSYRELDARANQLAHALRELGVGPEVRVALCLERSLDLVVGMLGILKAGGAYVPMDPAYPRERLAFMLQDCGARLVLTTLKELHRRHARRGLVSLCVGGGQGGALWLETE